MKVLIGDAEGIPRLLSMLNDPRASAATQERIAAMLQTLTVHPRNELRLTEGFAMLIRLLNPPTGAPAPRFQEYVLGAFQNAAVHPDNQEALVRFGVIPVIARTLAVQNATGPQAPTQVARECAAGIMQSIATSPQPAVREALVEGGLVPTIVANLQIAQQHTAPCVEYLSGTLQNLSGGPSGSRVSAEVASCGGVPALVAVVATAVHGPSARECAAMALHRILARHEPSRATALIAGAHGVLITAVGDFPNPKAKECVMRTIAVLQQ
eukprot:NODE_2435_length_1201_cov_23.836806_g2221_i0.p1 GENE.NODE_2435_length_1201_cov_23.836806_g2221_i0~~NODE_2435_length_1201_cov_23.836806_g2221_i0.p1  ORF type:complete len:268 (-),score=46.24 NODE_2435_length_1201_cov_23.836806_g2221_i0:110-913(-)